MKVGRDGGRLQIEDSAQRSVLLKGSEKKEKSQRDSASPRRLGLRGKHSERDKEVG